MTYLIDYTDPLKPTFTIAPGTFNGPGGIANATTLRLFGQGTAAWGEATNENFLRLLENFAGATAPANPNGGQVWLRQKLYHKNTSVADPCWQWYYWNFEAPRWNIIPTSVGPVTPVAGSCGEYFFNTTTLTLYRWISSIWVLTPSTSGPTTPGSGSSGEFFFNTSSSILYRWDLTGWVPLKLLILPSLPVSGFIGQYVFNATDEKLYRWDTQYAQSAPAWLVREYSSSNAVPVLAPTVESLFYHEFSSTWNSLSSTTINKSSSVPPSGLLGELFVNTLTGEMFYWNGSSWMLLSTGGTGNFVQKTGDTMALGANLTFQGGGKVTGIATPTLASDATTKSYVDVADTTNATAAIAANNNANTRVLKSGDTMTGSLTLNADPASNLHAATKQYVDSMVVGGVPAGAIIMWAPSAGAIPTGWALCDGSLGTPDLRRKFVVGGTGVGSGALPGGSNNNPAVFSGLWTFGTSFAGSHNHTGATLGHNITVAELPPHDHFLITSAPDAGVFGMASPTSSNYVRVAGQGNSNVESYVLAGTPSVANIGRSSIAGSGGGHAHGINGDGFHQHTSSFTPEYYALVFIMKLGAAGTVVNPLTFNGLLYTQTGNGLSTQGINLSTSPSGTWSIFGTVTGALATGNWYNPTTPGIGATYYIRYILLSSSGSGFNASPTPLNTWVVLGPSGTSVFPTANTGSVYNTSWQVDISSSPSGIPIVSTSTVNLNITNV